MIFSIGGGNGFGLWNDKYVNQKGRTTDFRRLMDTVRIDDDSEGNGRYGISPEEKEALKQKYGSCELKVGDSSTEKLMEELKGLGVITEEESKCGTYLPSWPCRIGAYTTDAEWDELEGADTRKSFRVYAMLQKKEAENATTDNVRDFFTNAAGEYEKLANIMDYIFS